MDFASFLDLTYFLGALKSNPLLLAPQLKLNIIANTTCKILWLQSLLKELGIFLDKPPTLLCNNLGATYLSVNSILHSRTKHVELNYHFARDRVDAKTLQVSFIPTHD